METHADSSGGVEVRTSEVSGCRRSTKQRKPAKSLHQSCLCRGQLLLLFWRAPPVPVTLSYRFRRRQWRCSHDRRDYARLGPLLAETTVASPPLTNALRTLAHQSVWLRWFSLWHPADLGTNLPDFAKVGSHAVDLKTFMLHLLPHASVCME